MAHCFTPPIHNTISYWCISGENQKCEKIQKRHREAFVGTKSTHVVTKDDLETMAISTFSTYFKRVNTDKVGD